MLESASTLSSLVTDPNWDKAVASQPQHTFFHSSAWVRVLQDTYRYQPFYLLDRNGAGCLPLMEVNSWITGRRGVSLPFTDECLPLASSPEAARELLWQAIRLGEERGWRYFASKGGGSLIPEAAVGQPSYFSHSLNLQRSADALFDGFSEANRRAIRKAQRAKVSLVMATDLDSLKCYYRLHCLTRKRFGLPPQPWRLFQQIHRHVLTKDLGFILLARHEERTIAGAVFCYSGKHAVFKFGASDRDFQIHRPNNLILWEAVQKLAAKGFETLSLGRTSTANEGLRRFKLSWGSTEHRMWYLNYDYRIGQFVTRTDDAYGWHNHVFQRLPGIISRLAGNLLYRHWA
jgi:hypothetical protein